MDPILAGQEPKVRAMCDELFIFIFIFTFCSVYRSCVARPSMHELSSMGNSYSNQVNSLIVHASPPQYADHDKCITDLTPPNAQLSE